MSPAPRARSAAAPVPLLLAATAATLAGTAAGAAAQDTLQVIGARQMTIPAERAADSRLQLPEIPVRYEPGDAAGAPSLRAVRVVRDGRDEDPNAFEFTLARDDRGEPVLRARVDLARAREAGSYAVTVEATHEGPDAPGPQLLEFTFTRPAAELRIATPIRLERVITLPGRRASPEPGTLLLSEVGGSAAFLPAQRVWLAELRGTENQPAEGRLRVTFPAGVDAWGQDTVTLALEGPLPLGTVTGTMTVRSHQLADRALDFPVEVVSRVSRGWLLATILAGILLGWFVRDLLEDRQQRTRARIAAEEQRGRLRGLIEETVDPGLRDGFQQVLRVLGAAIAAPAADAGALERAARTAEEETERLLAEADEKRAALADTIARWRAALGSAETQPAEIAVRVEDALERFAGQEDELIRGSIRPVETALESDTRSLPGRLQEGAHRWLAKLSNGIERMGPWAGTRVERVAEEIAAEVDAIREALAGSSTPEQIGPLLGRTAGLARWVRHDLLDSGLPAIERLAEDVLRALEKEADPTLEPALDRLREGLAALQRVPRQEAELPRLADAVHTLRRAVAAALSEATPASAAEAPAPAGLGEGEFGRALHEVIARRAARRERVLGGPAVGGPPAELLRAGPEPEWLAKEAGAPAWALRITATPARPSAGEPVALLAEVVVPDGTPTPAVSICWEVGGQPGGQGPPGHLTHQFTPRRSGPLVVRAIGLDAVSGNRAAAEIVLQIRPPEGLAAIGELSERLRRDELLKTAVSGILIAVAGFVIFQGAFVGTPADFLAALLWGFSADIGVARILEMGAPLAARPVPLPGAAP